MPPENETPDTEESRTRLGSVERAILDLLNADGGPVPRSQIVRALYPMVHPDRHGDDWWAAAHTGATRRTLVEATVSRAIGSLVRKGLIVRERQRSTGRTILRSTRMDQSLPDWETAARAEEDFAAHAASRAEHWRTLAARARQRALQLRDDRRVDSTADDRSMDVRMARRLGTDGRDDDARDRTSASGFSLSRTVLRLMRRRDTVGPAARDYRERMTDPA